MTFPSALSDLLIDFASSIVSPEAPVLAALSDPARSTRVSLPEVEWPLTLSCESQQEDAHIRDELGCMYPAEHTAKLTYPCSDGHNLHQVRTRRYSIHVGCRNVAVFHAVVELRLQLLCVGNRCAFATFDNHASAAVLLNVQCGRILRVLGGTEESCV